MKQDASSATSIHISHPQIHEQSSQAHSTLTGGELGGEIKSYLHFKLRCVANFIGQIIF